jgi:cell division protein FtsB
VSVPAVDRRELRSHVRDASRRRRRGGLGRAPVPVQRVARRVEDTALAARDMGVAAVSGDRPFVLALLAVLAVGVVMLSGPTQNYLDGRQRIALLEQKQAALVAENAALEERAAELVSPRQVELLAREQLGMVPPGEVPYALVPPEVERPRIAPPRELGGVTDDAPWWVRAWTTLTDTFR